MLLVLLLLLLLLELVLLLNVVHEIRAEGRGVQARGVVEERDARIAKVRAHTGTERRRRSANGTGRREALVVHRERAVARDGRLRPQALEQVGAAMLALAHALDSIAVGQTRNQWDAATELLEQDIGAVLSLVFGHTRKYQV